MQKACVADVPSVQTATFQLLWHLAETFPCMVRHATPPESHVDFCMQRTVSPLWLAQVDPSGMVEAVKKHLASSRRKPSRLQKPLANQGAGRDRRSFRCVRGREAACFGGLAMLALSVSVSVSLSVCLSVCLSLSLHPALTLNRCTLLSHGGPIRVQRAAWPSHRPWSRLCCDLASSFDEVLHGSFLSYFLLSCSCR